MSKKINYKTELGLAVIMSASIDCDMCDKSSEIAHIDDSLEAADAFYEEGWRATPNRVYCKKCAKKYLKSKK